MIWDLYFFHNKLRLVLSWNMPKFSMIMILKEKYSIPTGRQTQQPTTENHTRYSWPCFTHSFVYLCCDFILHDWNQI